MANSKRVMWSCDAPKCRTERPEGADGELPYGFYGHVAEIAEWGGSADVPWYACQVSHITSAIRGVLDKRGEA